jgi:hypothetical protein
MGRPLGHEIDNNAPALVIRVAIQLGLYSELEAFQARICYTVQTAAPRFYPRQAEQRF